MKFTLPIDKLLQDERHISARACDHAECQEEGLYPAPKNRDQLREFYWFCLEHVRAYNASWNYYAGMNEGEIEADRYNASKWERPTWPLGQKIKQHIFFHHQGDPLGIFHEAFTKQQRSSSWFAPNSPENKALQTLELSWPLTETDLKKRYKELAKKSHPDINQQDPHANETFKKINEAYVVLKGVLTAKVRK